MLPSESSRQMVPFTAFRVAFRLVKAARGENVRRLRIMVLPHLPSAVFMSRMA